MPLTLLLPIVVCSITSVLVLTWALGWSKPAILTVIGAKDRFRQDYPGAEIQQVVLTTDQTAAVLKLKGQWAAVIGIGAKFATRHLRPAACTWDDNTLIVQLQDFGCPNRQLAFTADDAASLKRELHA